MSNTTSTTSSTTEIEARPLTDDDVDEMRKRIAKCDPDKLNDIYNKYSQTLNGMITFCEKQTKDEEEIIEISGIRRLINLAPIDERFLRTKDKIWQVRNHILAKDAEYFINKDYKNLIKKDKKQTMIETLVGMVKRKYVTLQPEIKEKYWEKAYKLLGIVAQYKKLVGES